MEEHKPTFSLVKTPKHKLSAVIINNRERNVGAITHGDFIDTVTQGDIECERKGELPYRVDYFIKQQRLIKEKQLKELENAKTKKKHIERRGTITERFALMSNKVNEGKGNMMKQKKFNSHFTINHKTDKEYIKMYEDFWKSELINENEDKFNQFFEFIDKHNANNKKVIKTYNKHIPSKRNKTDLKLKQRVLLANKPKDLIDNTNNERNSNNKDPTVISMNNSMSRNSNNLFNSRIKKFSTINNTSSQNSISNKLTKYKLAYKKKYILPSSSNLNYRPHTSKIIISPYVHAPNTYSNSLPTEASFNSHVFLTNTSLNKTKQTTLESLNSNENNNNIIDISVVNIPHSDYENVQIGKYNKQYTFEQLQKEIMHYENLTGNTFDQEKVEESSKMNEKYIRSNFQFNKYSKLYTKKKSIKLNNKHSVIEDECKRSVTRPKTSKYRFETFNKNYKDIYENQNYMKKNKIKPVDCKTEMEMNETKKDIETQKQTKYEKEGHNYIFKDEVKDYYGNLGFFVNDTKQNGCYEFHYRFIAKGDKICKEARERLNCEWLTDLNKFKRTVKND